MHIIEYIGASGVRTTKGATRFKRPHPGDPVEVPEGLGYPWNHGGIGRIDSCSSRYGTDKWCVCVRGGSVFLQDDGTVSISGGPFKSVWAQELEPTHDVKVVGFWNWGDNFPGAGRGVDYQIARPLFK